MQGNRKSKVKTFLTFRLSTKCRKIGKAGRRLSLRSGSALNVGKQGKQVKTFPTFRFSTKCREIRKARRKLSLRFGSTLNVWK